MILHDVVSMLDNVVSMFVNAMHVCAVNSVNRQNDVVVWYVISIEVIMVDYILDVIYRHLWLTALSKLSGHYSVPK